MKLQIKRLNNDVHFEARNEDGASLQMDGSPELGGTNQGLRPTQLLLAAIGGCSGIDVVSILKKQKQEITGFEIEVDATKENVEEYSLWRNIHLIFKLQGHIDPQKAERAVALSIEKYCSVSKTLEPTANITYSVSVTNTL